MAFTNGCLMNDSPIQRRLKAIVIADVYNYSKLMMDDDEHTVETISTYREIIGKLIEKHQGRVVDSPGDNIMAEFDSALNAVNGSIEIQTTLKNENQQLPIARRMSFRIGISLGDIIQKDNRIYGDGVNIAARIQQVADPGGICISRGIYDQVKKKLNRNVEDVGLYSIKKLPEPVMIYRICQSSEDRKKKGSRLHWPHAKKMLCVSIACILAPIIVFLWVLQSEMRQTEGRAIETTAIHLPEERSIAVLPFVRTGGDLRKDCFCAGIPEQVIAALLDVPCMHVVAARDPLLAHGSGDGSVYPGVKERRVRFLLEGSVQYLNNQVRITTRLVDLTTSRYIWAETFDRELKNMFALQDDIATAIIEMLQDMEILSTGNWNGRHTGADDTDPLFSDDDVVIE